MMKKLIVLIVSAIMLVPGCTPEPMPDNGGTNPAKGPITVKGVVYDNENNRLAGVVVSDCFKTTVTDEAGVFELDSDLNTAKFVFVSIPSGYSVPVVNGIPVFYRELSKEQNSGGQYQLEFILNKVVGDPDKYSLLIAADPQPRAKTAGYDKIAYHSLDCCNDLYKDMREKAKTIKDTRPCYGIVLGDIVHENMNLFNNYIDDGLKKMGFPTFNVLGNHDNDYKAKSDVEGARVFEEKFGPSNYSFNIGKIHFVVLDNLIMKLNKDGQLKDYDQGLRDDIWEWLKSDLSHVDRNTTIMTCTHAPLFMTIEGSDRYKSAKHGADYALLLSKFKKVYAWAGHTHTMFNYIYSNDMSNIEVHTLSRSTGELWTNEYLASGTPRGYVVVDVDGENVSWKFKPVIYQTGSPSGSKLMDYSLRAWNYDEDGVAKMKSDDSVLTDAYQMNVYPRKSYGDNYVYAHVFMWDDKWSKPQFISDSDKTPKDMSAVTTKGYMYDLGQKAIYDFYKANSSSLKGDSGYSWAEIKHKGLFRIISSKNSDSGVVRVTDRFGNVYETAISW